MFRILVKCMSSVLFLVMDLFYTLDKVLGLVLDIPNSIVLVLISNTKNQHPFVCFLLENPQIEELLFGTF